MHSATDCRIEHPLRDLQESTCEILFDATAEHCTAIPGKGMVHRHHAVVQRVPRVTDFSRFNTMGVALSTCTTKTGLILDWGRTLPEVELQRRCRHTETRSSRCRDSADCITGTWWLPKTLQGSRFRLNETVCLESAKGAFFGPIRLTSSRDPCQIQTQVCSLNNHGNTRLENTQFLSFGEAQRR